LWVKHGPAVLAEDLDGLLEELVARVELLVDVVARVVAVLPDDEHRVHRQPLAAAAQRPGDRR
jgi:hypothetical protein